MRRQLAEVSLTPYVGFPPNPKDHTDNPERSRVFAPPAPLPPRRGWARPWGGRSAVLPPVPVYRGSTAQAQGLYPWLYGGGLTPAGAYLGIDCLTGGAFSCHPLAWLADGLVSNPNILVTGVPGAGKSATIKALALRLMCFGVGIAGDLRGFRPSLRRSGRGRGWPSARGSSRGQPHHPPGHGRRCATRPRKWPASCESAATPSRCCGR